MKKITVYCGANFGYDKNYENTAAALGKILANKGIEVIYGGAKTGLMGVVADGALQAGGSVVGIIPKFLMDLEMAHEGLTDLITTKTMHERKVLMGEKCDCVIALLGGFGTLEKLFEMLAWGQLDLHKKTIGLLNTNGFYDSLMVFIEKMSEEGFLRESNKKMVLISDSIEDLLKKMD